MPIFPSALNISEHSDIPDFIQSSKQLCTIVNWAFWVFPESLKPQVKCVYSVNIARNSIQEFLIFVAEILSFFIFDSLKYTVAEAFVVVKERVVTH